MAKYEMVLSYVADIRWCLPEAAEKLMEKRRHNEDLYYRGDGRVFL